MAYVTLFQEILFYVPRWLKDKIVHFKPEVQEKLREKSNIVNTSGYISFLKMRLKKNM